MKRSEAGARIVIMSSFHVQLCRLLDTASREQLSDPEVFIEATIDEVAERYFAACEAGPEESEKFGISYAVSKVLVTAYTRALAKRLASPGEGEKICVNCVHPGVVLTDSYSPVYGPGIPVAEGADTTVWLALRPKGGPSGKFSYERKEFSWVGTWEEFPIFEEPAGGWK